jgi:hypothetical protein
MKNLYVIAWGQENGAYLLTADTLFDIVQYFMKTYEQRGWASKISIKEGDNSIFVDFICEDRDEVIYVEVPKTPEDVKEFLQNEVDPENDEDFYFDIKEFVVVDGEIVVPNI